MLFVRSSRQRSLRHIACLNQEWEKAHEKNGFNFGTLPMESQLKACGNKCSHLLITFFPCLSSLCSSSSCSSTGMCAQTSCKLSNPVFFSTLLTSWRQAGCKLFGSDGASEMRISYRLSGLATGKEQRPLGTLYNKVH